jgi:CheY-like chemotaxis protein
VPTLDVKKIFGSVVRDWRNHLGLSQEELAERADLHPTYISSIERGARNVSLENISKLARALEISVSALFESQNQAATKNNHGNNGQAKNAVDVLLVEDNPDDAMLTLQAFKEARFRNKVTVVGDGVEALDYVFCRGKYAHRKSAEHPHIILLDLNLPKVSGLEVLRRIKADKKTRMIPVVILTISDDNYDIAECRRLGAENYIVKPVDFQRLSQATPRLNLDWVLVLAKTSRARSIGV